MTCAGHITIEIISKDNKFSEEDVKDISKKVYEECRLMHLKKSGLLSEDDAQILLCFSFTTNYPSTIAPSSNAYKIQFSTKQAENNTRSRVATIIKEGM